MTASPCNVSGCPERATRDGMCDRCYRARGTTTAKGYGADWQRVRATLLAGAVCDVCGTSERLQLDHRLPRSLGGDDSPANLRPLCASHHAQLGLRSREPDSGRSADVVQFVGYA